MEYQIVWLTFFLVLFLLGVSAAISPRRVIYVLRQVPTAPERRYVLVFSVLGGLVAAVCVIEIISIIKRGHIL